MQKKHQSALNIFDSVKREPAAEPTPSKISGIRVTIVKDKFSLSQKKFLVRSRSLKKSEIVSDDDDSLRL